VGIQGLIEDTEMDPLAREAIRNLIEGEHTSRQAVKLGDQEGVPLTHTVKAGLKLGAFISRTAGHVGIELLTVREPLPLDGEVLILR
jgi:hypothetical protein